MEENLKEMKEGNTKYIKEKSTEIMKLNNDTTQLNSVLEDIVEQQNSLKSEAAEISSKKLSKISELAQILMAINNIEQTCFNRVSKLRIVKHNITVDKPGDEKPANYDDLTKSVVYANKQLKVLKYYMTDYVEIIKGCQSENKEVQEYLNKLKDRNELI